MHHMSFGSRVRPFVRKASRTPVVIASLVSAGQDLLLEAREVQGLGPKGIDHEVFNKVGDADGDDGDDHDKVEL
jgi:hypothetical protein